MPSSFTPEEAKYVELLQSNNIANGMTQVKIAKLHSGEEVDITLQNGKTLHLFAKKNTNNLEEEAASFRRQSLFFSTFIKDAEIMGVDVVGSSWPIEVFPKCHLANDEIMLFDNVVRQGFTRIKKESRQMDLIHAILVLEKIARLHAASYVMIKYEELENFKEKYDVFLRDGDIQKSRMTKLNVDNALLSILKIIEMTSVPEAETVRELLTPLINREPQEKEEMLVLTHSNLHEEIIMFNEMTKRGRMGGVAITSIKNPRLSSSSLDIVNFLSSTVQQEVVRNNLYALLRSYHIKFVELVTTLGEAVEFKFEDFLQDFKNTLRSKFITQIINSCPVQIMDTDENANKIAESWANENPEMAESFVHEIIKKSIEYTNMAKSVELQL